jgi:tape measure domain-containing protein
MDLGYIIGIGIEDLASSPAGKIASTLKQLETTFAGLRSSMTGSNQGLSIVKTSLSGVTVSTEKTEKKIAGLRTELSEMKDFRSTLTVGVDDTFLKEVDTEIKRIESRIASLNRTSGNTLNELKGKLTGLSAQKSEQLAVKANTKPIDELKAKLTALQVDRQVMIDTKFNPSALISLDAQIKQVEADLKAIEQPKKVRIGADTAKIDSLKATLSGLNLSKEAIVKLKGDTTEIDGKINAIKSELQSLEKPKSVAITGASMLDRVKVAFQGLTGAISDETATAKQSATANANFISMLNGLPQKADSSSRSIDRLNAEIQQLTNRRNTLDIKVDSKEIIKSNALLKELEREIRKVKGESNGGWFKDMMSGGAMGFLTGNLLFSGVQGVFSSIKDSYTGAMDLQSTKISYGTFAQNKAIQKAEKSGKPYDEKAVREQALAQSDKTIADLNKYADATKFENSDLMAVGAKMSGYMEQKDIVGQIKKFGDISGGDVGKLNSLELVYSQIKDAGKMQGQDLMQLINGGTYGIMEELAKVKGVKVNEIRGQMKDGLISFTDVDKALTNMTSKGGTFFGNMDAQSKTVEGKLSTLIGTFETMKKEFLISQNFPILNQIIDLGTAIISNIELIGKPIMNLVMAFKPVTDAIGNVFAKLTGGATMTEVVSKSFSVLGGVIDWIAGGVNVLANVFGYIIENPVAQWIGGLVTGAYALSGAMTLVNIVMSANPFLLFITGAALAVSGIRMLWENSETFRSVMTGVWEGVKAVWQPIGEFFTNVFHVAEAAFNTFSSFITGIWNGLIGVHNTAKGWISTSIDFVGAKITQAKTFLSGVFAPILTAWDGIKAKLGTVFDWIVDKVSKVVGFMGKIFNMLPQVQLAKWGINAGKQALDNFQAGFGKGKLNGSVAFKQEKAEKNKKKSEEDKLAKQNAIPPPFGGKDRDGKGKSIGDKSGINKTVEGTKPTVINISFGTITGVNQLTQTGNNMANNVAEIGDKVVEHVIRRITSSVAIAQ